MAVVAVLTLLAEPGVLAVAQTVLLEQMRQVPLRILAVVAGVLEGEAAQVATTAEQAALVSWACGM